jgi:hypothetical protein
LEIITIFAQDNPVLLSSKYEEDVKPEFEALFEKWQDVNYLFDFFNQNKADLKSGFYGNIEIEEAVLETLKDGNKLESKIRNLAIKSINGGEIGLDNMFQNLYPNERAVELILSKGYGNNLHRNTSWLRIYAIKLESNCYVVTGGMIKLTNRMEVREHGRLELNKLKRTRDYLRENGLLDKESTTDY